MMWLYGPWGPWMWIFPLICLSVMLLIVYSIFGGWVRGPLGGWNARDGGFGEQKPDSPLVNSQAALR